MCLGLLLAGSWAARAPAQQPRPPRFAALLSNGHRIEGRSLIDWHNNGADPRLEGQALVDPNNKMRWLRDRTMLPAPLPRAFVETHTGDRLPGTVVDAATGSESPFNVLPTYLRVRPEVDLKPPQPQREPVIRVVESLVRRVVWQKRERDDYQPSTLFFRDGRATQFRAARFGAGFVNVLLAEGNRRVSFHEIAELHLPAVDPWRAYFDEVATLDPKDAACRMLQIETNDGLVITGNYDKRQFFAHGGNQEFERWIHGLQPAWSLDVIYVPTQDIATRRMWLPHEVPLTRIMPASAAAHSPLGVSGRVPQANRNVMGGPLRSGKLDYGWGFGVHATTELAFALPRGVKSLRGRVGLDRAAGKGGCVRARVFVNQVSSGPLWESPFLIGAEAEADLGAIALAGPAQNQKLLILQVDAAHAGRPAGADPFDLRDVTNWYDPWLELDPAVVKEEVAARSAKHFAAWRDWSATQAQGGRLAGETYWNELVGSVGDVRVAIAPREQPLALTREFNFAPGDNWLVVFANRNNTAGPPPKLEVRIAGDPVTEYEVPYRHKGNEDQPPLAVSLSNYQGAKRPVTVEIRQGAQPEHGYLDWRAIGVVSQLPHLYRAFEDQGAFAAIDGDQSGSATLNAEERYYGAQSVQITPSGQFRLPLEKPVKIREQPAWGEYRLVRFAFRKVGGGRTAMEIQRDAPADSRPVRYDMGVGEPVLGSATRAYNQELPDHWLCLTRDLYADFGALDATGITLTAPDGQHVLWDHIYFARRMEDFNLIPGAPPPELTNQMARRKLAQPILDRSYPAVAMLEMADGRLGTGVLIQQDGEIVTAGHLLANANQDCKVHLADGRTLAAKTRGIYRDLDLGLVKISEAGPYPFLERGNAADMPENQLYVAFDHGQKLEKGIKPAAHLVGLRRVFRGMVWTDFDLPEWTSGGPLLNREGKVVGVLARRSDFGGFLFARMIDFDAHWGRMRGGEVYGSWPSGLGPFLGIHVTGTRDGAKISDVVAKSPAAAAGLRSGDIITKVDGRSVVSLEDISALLSEKNAGHEVTLDYVRAGQMLQGKVKLAPRYP